MKISCDVINDLFPSYVEGLTSNDSNKIIEDHIQECTNCKETLELLKGDLQKNEEKSANLNDSSVKLFKRVRKKTFKYVGIALLIGILIGILGPTINSSISAKNSATKFFKNIKEENYEEAFEYLYYYDQASDLPPNISYEDAKEIWINRIKDLKENGTYLKSYNELQVRIDDSYAIGKLELTLVENGEEKTFETSIWFGPTSDILIGPIWFRTWKVGNLNDGTEKSEFEKAISGYITK
ncbi:zf-HC2 domain-containing protein [Clostridium sp. DL1XJH146]